MNLFKSNIILVLALAITGCSFHAENENKDSVSISVKPHASFEVNTSTSTEMKLSDASKPKLDEPKEYEKDGLEFAYPGNWNTLEAEETMAGKKVRSIMIASPFMSFGKVMVFDEMLNEAAMKDLLNKYSRSLDWEGTVENGKISNSPFGEDKQYSATVQVFKGKLKTKVAPEVPTAFKVTASVFTVPKVKKTVLVAFAGAQPVYKEIEPAFTMIKDSFEYEPMDEEDKD